MKLLVKLLRKNINAWQLGGFFIANLLGGIIMLLAFQAYRDFEQFMHGEARNATTNYVVISKPVSAINTLGNLLGAKAPSFSTSEIEALKEHPSVADVGAFTAASFNVSGHFALASIRVGTEMFLESVPDRFIDVDFEAFGIDWKADLGGGFLPVIVPRSYLNIYNFGFASTKGTPQLSDGIISSIPVEIRIRDKYRNTITYDARIVGFTERLNTILVPDSFLQAANAAYASKANKQPSRLVVESTPSADSHSLLQYFTDQGYVVEGSADTLKMKSFVYGLLLIVMLIGAIISLLAFMLLMISILLLIEKNKEKFINLHSLGYAIQQISLPYTLLVVIANSVVWLSAATTITLVYPTLSSFITLIAPDFQHASLLPCWLVALLLNVLFIALHRIVITKQIRKATHL
ncbi:MAG: ABC transporter permease [Bacteroides sp.]|nr:ABC transporter permease [Bacteroides sp.]